MDTVSAGSRRYGEADDDDIDLLTEEAQAKNTRRSTKYAVKILYEYCLSKGQDPAFENRSACDLNKLLKQFNGNVRRVDGNYYNRSSMCIIRQCINRHLKQAPHCKPFDIMTGVKFREANNMFKVMCRKLRKSDTQKDYRER